MKKPSFPLVLFSLLAVAAIIWLAAPLLSIRKEKPVPFNASPEVAQLINDNTVFALDLYQQLKLKPGNLSSHPSEFLPH
jgi:hypothetical protein